MGLLDGILGAIGGNATPAFGTPPFNPSGGSTNSGSGGGFNWGQFLSGVAPIATGVLGLIQGNNSANASKDAAKQANALAAQIYSQNRTDSLPWLNAGTGAINQLAYLMGIGNPNAFATPGYNPNAGSTNALARGNPRVMAGANVAPQLRNTLSASLYGGPTLKPYQSLENVDDRGQLQRSTIAGFDAENGQPFANGVTGGIPYEGSGFGPRSSWSGEPITKTATLNGQPATNQGAPDGFGSLNHDFNMDDFYANMDPGYGFRLEEGNKAYERSAAAKGGLLGGGQQKQLARYNQGFASNEYGNAFNRFESNRAGKFNRLAAVSGIGQTQANTLANLSTNYGNTVSDNLINSTLVANNARQSGYGQLINGAIGTANALNNPLNALAKYYQQQGNG